MGSEKLWLILPGTVFLVYFANVVAGAAGLGVFLSDVASAFQPVLRPVSSPGGEFAEWRAGGGKKP